MAQKKKVLVVSSFGRGQWLSSEIAGFEDVEVTLVDASETLGRWTPEDWEGPFGFFQPESITQTQLGRLNSEDYHDAHPQGFSVWMQDGPIDFKGPLTQFWLDQDGPMTNLKDYFDHAWDSQKSKKALQLFVQKMEFDKSWLIHLSHQMASTEYVPNALSAYSGEPVPLFSSWSTRRVSRKGYQRLGEWCESKGVKYIPKSLIKDVDVQQNRIVSLEIEAPSFRGVVGADYVVWCLTQGEVRRMGAELYPKVFAGPIVEPEWSWVRYRMQLDLDKYENTVPGHFLLIEDKNLPWTHENMLIAQKVVTGTGFDVWLRIPHHQRFQRKSLEEYADRIEKIFESRIPGSSPGVLEMPQEFHYEFEELGSALFPVYEPASRKGIKKHPFKNVVYSSPETWERLDWTGRFQFENSIIREVADWKQAQDRKEKKVDSEVHAP